MERFKLLLEKEPIGECREFFKGRAGIKDNARSYYLYLLKPENVDYLSLRDHESVTYSKKYLDKRGTKGESKSQVISKFLKEKGDRAWYSKVSQAKDSLLS